MQTAKGNSLFAVFLRFEKFWGGAKTFWRLSPSNVRKKGGKAVKELERLRLVKRARRGDGEALAEVLKDLQPR